MDPMLCAAGALLFMGASSRLNHALSRAFVRTAFRADLRRVPARWRGRRLRVRPLRLVLDAADQVIDGTVADGLAVPAIEKLAHVADDLFALLVLGLR